MTAKPNIILPQPKKLVRQDRCENCSYSEPEANAKAGNRECHFYPPAVGFVMSNKGPTPVSAYPVVRPNQWCGQHARKITSVSGGVK